MEKTTFIKSIIPTGESENPLTASIDPRSQFGTREGESAKGSINKS